MRDRREVVVVTGATSGVGRGVVERFARDGAAIGLLARGEDAWKERSATRHASEASGSPFPRMWPNPNRWTRPRRWWSETSGPSTSVGRL
jgi:NAD(P)-dependent dehydrogenase (short-subunit alcohol dehydrogenase family)